MIQAAFLTSLFIGLGLLIAAIGLARFNWRSDIEPYGRNTRPLHLVLNPERYVLPGAAAKVRLIGVSGIFFLLLAACALACQLAKGFFFESLSL